MADRLNRGRETVMLPSDRTGQLATERVADLHRQAERHRLVRLAWAHRRGGTSGVGRWRRWRVGDEVRVRASWSPRPRRQQLDHRRPHELAMTDVGAPTLEAAATRDGTAVRLGPGAWRVASGPWVPRSSVLPDVGGGDVGRIGASSWEAA
jgi:hypothetical protein